MNNYKKTIPARVSIYLNSLKSADFNVLIIKRNNIESNEIKKYASLIVQIFNCEIEINNIINQIKVLFNFDDPTARSLALDIAGMRLLVVNGWFDRDIKDYIISLGGKPEDYQKYVDEHRNAIIEEEKYFAEMLKEPEPYVFTPAPEEPETAGEEISEAELLEHKRKKLIEFLSKNLIDMLTMKDRYIALELTYDMIRFMGEQPTYKRDLESALYNNQETIGHNNILSAGRLVTPAISNWLKDFIQQNGAGIPDSLKISNFVANSKNAKILNEEEKNLLRKLLTLYRNLKFFPESMGNLPPEKWEIIPVDADERGLMRTDADRSGLAQTANKHITDLRTTPTPENPKTKPENPENITTPKKQITDLRTDIRPSGPQIKEGGSGGGILPQIPNNKSQITNSNIQNTRHETHNTDHRSRIEAESSSESGSRHSSVVYKDPRLVELENLRDQFPVGSLERKAIEEEIFKINS